MNAPSQYVPGEAHVPMRDRVLASGLASVALIALTLGHSLARKVAGQLLAEAHASALSYEVNRDGTVTDAVTGLVWQHVVDESVHTQAAALAYCAGLSLAGGDWRLPLKAELESIADTTVASTIQVTSFPNTSADYFWSSSPDVGVAGSAGLAYLVGSSAYFDSTTALRVRCVR